MRVQPFVIKTLPVGDAHWVVVPDEGLDSVQVCLDIGGGTGPVVGKAEWIRSKAVEEGGFLYWEVNGDVLPDTPTWMPAVLEKAVRDMAQAMFALRHQKHSEA